MIYKVYYEYEDEHDGFTDDLIYYKKRTEAENYLMEKALKNFPDNIESQYCRVNPKELIRIRNTSGTGKEYYHIEEIYVH